MTAPRDEDAPRVVIRDKRRIDPISGTVRVPAGDEPAGTTPGSRADAPDAVAREEQMSEQETAVAEESVQPESPTIPPTGGGDAEKQLAERTEDLQRVTAEYANYRRRVHRDLTGAFKVVADRVLGLLDGLGVTAFGVAGDPFDPALHEAVLHDTSPDVGVPTATTVLRPGFRRGDRVLRTAMVGVSEPENTAPVAVEEPAAAPSGEQP